VPVIITAIAFDLGDKGPIIKIVSSFVEGVIGRCGSLKQVEKLWWHGFGCFLISIIRGEGEVDSEGVLIVVLANKKVDMPIGAKFDPLGISIVAISNGDLGGIPFLYRCLQQARLGPLGGSWMFPRRTAGSHSFRGSHSQSSLTSLPSSRWVVTFSII
jgi:hypothetical protein